MTILQWERIPTNGDFMKKMRRELRIHRREKGRGGHEFVHDDVRTLWASGDDYAILTHNSDRVWQFWWRHPEQGWALQSWHRLLADAKQEADKPRILALPSVKAPEPGLYVCAVWQEPYSGNRPLMVRCSSDYTATEVTDMFLALGCQTSTKTVV